jgi:hypothetical protein
MSFSRYSRRNKKKNESTLYSDHFEKRNVDQINQYTTPEFKRDQDYSYAEFNIEYYTWKSNDRMYKVAERVYGDPSLWWVICQFNQKPTDSLFREGDLVLIPHNLEKVLGYMGV